MDILFLLRLSTGILFATAIVPAIYLGSIFYAESKRVADGLRLINGILFVSAVLGALALFISIIITFLLVFEHPVSALNFNIRNLIVAIFFNIPTWGLLYVRKHSK